ncbi:MAG: OmpA family protein [Sandaracinus sp.]
MRLLGLLVSAALSAWIPARTWAQPAASEAAPPPAIHPSPWGFGAALLAGAMVSDDQRGPMHFGGGGGMARLELRVRPFDELDWLEGDVRASFAVVGPGADSGVGGILDFGLGVRAAPRVGDARLWVGVAIGLGLTGPFGRPTGTLGAGIAFLLGDEVTLGPEIQMHHLVQWDAPGASSDAIFLSGGASFAYRPVSRPPEPEAEPAPIVVQQHEQVTHWHPPPAPEPSPTYFEELDGLMTAAVCGDPAPSPVVTLLPPVLFEHDASVLTAAGEVAMHDVLARIVEAPAELRVIVEGHADATGTDDYNELLAFDRARTVADWLVAHGLPEARVEARGQGERAPLVDGASIDALAPNRRVTIRLEPASVEPPTPAEEATTP